MIYKRKVKKVIDGDTLSTYSKVNGTTKIRLVGVRAPEKNQKGGKTATNLLKKSVSGKFISVKPKAKDKYGRTIASVSYKGRSVNNKMRKAGYTNKGR